nr:integrase, catalytic region, zinc finger, CCHC-type, peptidase aspartic, catalytic [Tanacetum cinerariifolium]
MTGNRALLTNFVEKFFGTVRFGNNDFAVIAGYGDVKENQEKDKNRTKTGQKQEACRSRENFKAVAVERGRKTEENKKRMVENAYTVKELCKFKEKKKREGPFLQFQESTTTGA